MIGIQADTIVYFGFTIFGQETIIPYGFEPFN